MWSNNLKNLLNEEIMTVLDPPKTCAKTGIWEKFPNMVTPTFANYPFLGHDLGGLLLHRLKHGILLKRELICRTYYIESLIIFLLFSSLYFVSQDNVLS